MSKWSKKRILEAVSLVVFGLTLVTAIVLIIDCYLIMPTFRQLEQQQAIEDAERLIQSLENTAVNLGVTANDWAYWDDTFAFALEPSAEFIESNYPNPKLISDNSKIDLLVIFDHHDQILIQGGYHPELEEQITPEQILEPADALATLVAPVKEQQAEIQGLLQTSKGPLFFAARPILDNEKRGPPRGVLIMGRFLTQELEHNISARIQVSFVLQAANASSITAAEHPLLDQLTSSVLPQHPIYRDQILYQLLPDITGKPAFFLRSNSRGKILELGHKTSHYLQAVLLFIALNLLICLAVYRSRMQLSQLSLKESETRYRSLFANRHTVMLLIDPENGEIVDANPAASQFYGWSVEELRSMTIREINTLTAAEIKAEMMSATLEKRHHFLFSHRKADGSAVEVEVYSCPLSIEGKKLLYSIVHDISARRMAEKALKESYACLQAITNSLDSIIYIADMQSHELLFVNARGAEVFGDSILGKKCWQVIQGQDQPCSFCTNDSLVDENGQPTGAFRWESKNLKNNRLYDITNHAIRWSGGRLVRLEVATDITERRQSEELQRELEQQLHQGRKAESLSRMAGAVAHHYNNLLAGVIGNLELAQMDLPGSPRLKIYLDDATKTAYRAAEIGQMMLDYLGHSFATQTQLDLARVCLNRLEKLKTQLPPQIDLLCDLKEPGPTVQANEKQLGQVISNLLSNAVESIAEQPGSISFKIDLVTPEDLPTVHLVPQDFLPTAERYCCLSVIDTGCGIEQDDLDKIFDPFYSTKFAGRGLGLPVVAGVIKAHEGCIAVSSEQTMGSHFRVYLPMQQQHLPASSSKADSSKTIEMSGTVLVVEDEPFLRQVASDMLGRLGFTPLSARDGAEALQIFRDKASSICCVVTDLTMPRMDGWQTISAIRQLAPKMPFVLVSEHNSAEVMPGDHPEAPQAFLQKPYNLENLRRTLYTALSSSKPH